MAKALIVARRDRDLSQDDLEALHRSCRLVAPDNLRSPPEPWVRAGKRIGMAVACPGAGCRLGDDGVALGFRGAPGGDPAAGCDVLFRLEPTGVRARTDALATRTVWYFQDDEVFLASTSQFMILAFIGTFELDRETAAWMLSSGTLGPGRSWDRRIRRMEPDAELRLDFESWTVRQTAPRIGFVDDQATPEELRRRLRQRIAESVARLADLDWRKCALTLSGGYDSRAILLFLRESSDAALDTITWGKEEIRHDPESDAGLAASLAERFEATNTFYRNDSGPDPIEVVLERFVRCGEGRTSSLTGYLDGCEMWRHLREDRGTEVIVRGDEAFGWSGDRSEREVRRSVGIRVADDVAGLPQWCRLAELPRQQMPEQLRRRRGESLADWRDRLYQCARVPTYLAGLSEPKVAYVETVSPLISREILDAVRRLPEPLRTRKRLFREIVDGFGVDVPYCSRRSEDSSRRTVARDDIRSVCAAELRGGGAREVFPQAFLDAVLTLGATGTEPAAARRGALRRLLDRMQRKRPLSPALLLFRCYVIVKSVAICREVSRRRDASGRPAP